MTLFSAAAFGAVQGITEFLPVSSSAHLIFAREMLGWDLPPQLSTPFDVACHVGTLAAVLVFFRADIAAMARALPQALGPAPGPDGRRIQMIAVATLPIVIVGFLWADLIKAYLQTPLVAATALIAGAGLLFLIERMHRPLESEAALSRGGAFLVGVAQSAALIPGVSRSGATIVAGMALGLRRDVAARFSFLMSIPAIVAAAAKEGLELQHVGLGQQEVAFFVVGTCSSALVGYFTVKYFVRFLATHRLDVFAWYRIALGTVLLVWLAVR